VPGIRCVTFEQQLWPDDTRDAFEAGRAITPGFSRYRHESFPPREASYRNRQRNRLCARPIDIL
jgi:hypothetical protein